MSAAPDPAPLLHPRSVAVVGANERAGGYGDVIFRNLASAGFEGAVYGVNPKREVVHGRPCVPTVADLPEPVDAVVIAIPAAACAPVLIEAGETCLETPEGAQFGRANSGIIVREGIPM